MTILYRAIDLYRFTKSYTIEISVGFNEYNIIEETDKSYLINIVYEKPKRVLKATQLSEKRFAYRTKEFALNDLKIRRVRELAHLNRRVSNIMQGIKYLKTYKIGDPPILGTTDFIECD